MPLATYVCSLSEESIKKAKEELNEDPKERLGALQSLREWTDTQPWINTPTGIHSIYGPRHAKRVFKDMRTAKAQISLRIRSV